MKKLAGVTILMTYIFAYPAFADHSPYQTGVFEKKYQRDKGLEAHEWVWVVSINDTVYELRGIYGDRWLSELPIGSPVKISVGGKHLDRAWIHFDGKRTDAEFAIVGTSKR